MTIKIQNKKIDTDYIEDFKNINEVFSKYEEAKKESEEWKTKTILTIEKLISREEMIEKLKSLKSIFDRNHINKLHLVGSFSRNEQTKDSDVDLILSVEKWARFTLFNIWNLKHNLEKNLWTEVDLVLEGWIRKEMEPFLNKDKILIF